MKARASISLTVLLTLLCLALSEMPAQAYLDPGSGSLLAQLLLGGLAGGVIAVRMYWRRLVSRFRSGGPGNGTTTGEQ